MADTDAVKEAKQFYENIPMQTPGFFLRGAGSLDWGMKNRLARIFNPQTARTVMLAIDHGYFQGPTTGLERVDLNIVPLMPMADALMLTRGILRTTVPPAITKPIAGATIETRRSVTLAPSATPTIPRVTAATM